MARGSDQILRYSSFREPRFLYSGIGYLLGIYLVTIWI